MAYSRRSVAQAQQLYKIASDAAYTYRLAMQQFNKIAGKNKSEESSLNEIGNLAQDLSITLDPPEKEPRVFKFKGSRKNIPLNQRPFGFTELDTAPDSLGEIVDYFNPENPAVENKSLVMPGSAYVKEILDKQKKLVEEAKALITPASTPIPNTVTTPASTTTEEVAKAVAANPSIFEKLKSYSGSTFDSLQGEKVPAFLKNLTKGQAAGGAAALAALLGGGAYMMNRSRKNKEREAAAAIMAAKNLSEAQRRKLLRNIGIGTGAALGTYGLYRAMR